LHQGTSFNISTRDTAGGCGAATGTAGSSCHTIARGAAKGRSGNATRRGFTTRDGDTTGDVAASTTGLRHTSRTVTASTTGAGTQIRDPHSAAIAASTARPTSFTVGTASAAIARRASVPTGKRECGIEITPCSGRSTIPNTGGIAAVATATTA
jgi:hypothetical protein